MKIFTLSPRRGDAQDDTYAAAYSRPYAQKSSYHPFASCDKIFDSITIVPTRSGGMDDPCKIVCMNHLAGAMRRTIRTLRHTPVPMRKNHLIIPVLRVIRYLN